MTKRRRPEDPMDLPNCKSFRAITALVPVEVYHDIAFLNGRSVDGRHIKRATIIIRYDANETNETICSKLVAEPAIISTNNNILVASNDEFPSLKTSIPRLLTFQPVCVAFLMGIAPKMGRNESSWVDVDEDTRKRVRSPPESSVHRAFVKHELAERQCIRMIFSFLF